MRPKAPNRWYELKHGISNRRLEDVQGHPIYMNAAIPPNLSPAIEGWEVRWDGRNIGIVWATRDHLRRLRWHWADISMRVGDHQIVGRRYAVQRLCGERRAFERERDGAARAKEAPELDDFQL